MNILVVGTGYVGLVSGACFAEMGHNVICLDIDSEKIKNLKNGKIPIYEPGLEEVVQRNIAAKRLEFTTEYKTGVENSTACFLALPTPSSEDGSADLSYIEMAAKEIALYMNDYKVIVNKSTVPVGSAFRVKEIIQKELSSQNKEIEFDVVSNPEFLKEGSAISDCLKPDRIVIGTDSQRAKKAMYEIYSAFTINHDCIIDMDILSSEMTKYAANAMLATRISFMNEISQICKRVGADVNNVRKGIGSDSRIGYSFLYAGIGYGGSCFPKDVKALIQTSKEVGYEPKLLNSVEEVNKHQKNELANTISKYFEKDGGVSNKTIAIWGLSFKPDTDDMREAPSLVIIKKLIEKGAKVKLFDPVAMENAKKMIDDHENITWCKDEFDAAHDADAIALLTEWKQFRLVNFSPIKKKMKQSVLFDGRNQYLEKEMKDKGFDYIGIGLPQKKIK
jgi:UDPglucose 6-dehydrogenase